MPDRMQTFEYLRLYNPVPFEKFKNLRVFRETFNSILSEARLAENQGEVKKAIEIYFTLIAEIMKVQNHGKD